VRNFVSFWITRLFYKNIGRSIMVTSIVAGSLESWEYLASYTDLMNWLRADGVTVHDAVAAARHYNTYALSEGRTITFNAWEYLASNSDLMNWLGADGFTDADAIAAARHYIEYGYNEGRINTFDAWEYLASNEHIIQDVGPNPDAAAKMYCMHRYDDPFWYMTDAEILVAAHYVTWQYDWSTGTYSDFDWSPYFDGFGNVDRHYYFPGKTVIPTTFNSGEYLASYPDLIQAIGYNTTAAAEHYVRYGYNEGRTITFDAWDYLASNADLMDWLGADGVTDADATAAAKHYIEYGYHEGRTITFDAWEYLASNPDLMDWLAADGLTDADATTAARHYIEYGVHEGRAITFDSAAYLASNANLQHLTYDILHLGGDAANDYAAQYYITHGRYEAPPSKGNHAPVAVDDALMALYPGGNRKMGNVLVNDRDPDESDTLSFMPDSTQYEDIPGFSMGRNGDYTFDPNNDAYLYLIDPYKHPPGCITHLTYKYIVVDNHGAMDWGKLTITIIGVPISPLVPTQVDELRESGPMFNSTLSPNGPFIRYTPAQGQDTVAGLIVNPDGSFSFNSADAVYDHLKADEKEIVTYNYTVSDGDVEIGSSTLVITVTGTNDAPVAVADVASATEGGAVITGSVAANDSDVDGNTLSFVAATGQGEVAGLSFSGNGSYTFDPTVAAYDHLNVGETEVVTYHYTVSDGYCGTANSSLAITVTGVNDVPAAVALTTGLDIISASHVTSNPVGMVNTLQDLDQLIGLGDNATLTAVLVNPNADAGYVIAPELNNIKNLEVEFGDTSYLSELDLQNADQTLTNVSVTGVSSGGFVMENLPLSATNLSVSDTQGLSDIIFRWGHAGTAWLSDNFQVRLLICDFYAHDLILGGYSAWEWRNIVLWACGDPTINLFDTGGLPSGLSGTGQALTITALGDMFIGEDWDGNGNIIEHDNGFSLNSVASLKTITVTGTGTGNVILASVGSVAGFVLDGSAAQGKIAVNISNAAADASAVFTTGSNDDTVLVDRVLTAFSSDYTSGSYGSAVSFAGHLDTGAGNDSVSAHHLAATAHITTGAGNDTVNLATDTSDGSGLELIASGAELSLGSGTDLFTITATGIGILDVGHGVVDGGSGIDTISVFSNNGANISAATVSYVETLSLTGAIWMTAAQHNAFTTILAPGGADAIVLMTTINGTANNAIEFYTLNSTGDDRLSFGGADAIRDHQSVNLAGGGHDTVVINNPGFNSPNNNPLTVINFTAGGLGSNNDVLDLKLAGVPYNAEYYEIVNGANASLVAVGERSVIEITAGGGINLGDAGSDGAIENLIVNSVGNVSAFDTDMQYTFVIYDGAGNNAGIYNAIIHTSGWLDYNLTASNEVTVEHVATLTGIAPNLLTAENFIGM
jgi:VCBS repeat-containing protein